MFLVTTADQRYWKTDEKILFLGEWCRIYDERHIWSKLNHEVLPYHWDDRQRLYQDYLHLQAVYERYLEYLAGRLNEIHQTNHSLRYWRIVVGPWLSYFMEILYDRYLSIRAAAESDLVTNTWIESAPREYWIPDSFSMEWSLNEQYNLYLYSRVIEAFDNLPFEAKEFPLAPVTENSGPVNGSVVRKVAKKFLLYYEGLVPRRWNKTVFVSSYLSNRNLLKIQLSLGQFPCFSAPVVEAPRVPAQPEMRESLVLTQGRDHFERILDKLLAQQIPKTYVEGYAEMDRRSAAGFPRKPKLIFTANASDEGFKFWAAGKTEAGAKLIVSQHGGFYGSCLWSSFEEHEISISDRYFTWGWQRSGDPKTTPLSAGKVIGMKGNLRPDPEGNILWVALSVPRHSIWLSSSVVGPQMLDYLDEQRRFAKHVCPEVHDLLLRRLYSHDYEWNELSRWQEIDPTLKCYRGPKPIREQLRQSRLAIATYNATTYLETFAMDFPTIVFWNPKHSEIRQAAQPYFNELREVGILHDTPESAAAKTNEIYQDPQSWWRQPMIQKTKDRFCERFVRTSRDWLIEWKAELLEQANSEAVGSRN